MKNRGRDELGSVVDSASDLGGKMEPKGDQRELKWIPKWIPNRQKIASKFEVDFECDLGINDGGFGGMGVEHQRGLELPVPCGLARHAPSFDRGRRIYRAPPMPPTSKNALQDICFL